jgi:hypothetical protein
MSDYFPSRGFKGGTGMGRVARGQVSGVRVNGYVSRGVTPRRRGCVAKLGRAA